MADTTNISKNISNVLEVRGLCKDYALTSDKPNTKKHKPNPNAFAVKDVSFTLPEGYIMGFVGPNGAGKTTVIKLLLQIKRRDAGSVVLFGKENAELQNNQNNHNNHNAHIGVVLDSPHFPTEWTLNEVEQGLSPFYTEWNQEQYANCLRQFGLDAEKKVRHLSRGMQVKLQIAVALSHNAKLLILDEPTSGLDPVARDEICDLIRDFVEDGKKSVLFSTHITSDLEKIADYMTIIQDRRIRYTGTKDELMEKYVRVIGGINDIDATHEPLIIGLRKLSTGFEGMIETANIKLLPKSVLQEPINLEEIVVFMYREGKRDEST